MARTMIPIICKDAQTRNGTIEQILMSNGYKQIFQRGEKVWKRGTGVWTAIKYIKIDYPDNDNVVISGWVKPILGSEQDLDGFVGVIPKKDVKKVIQQIQIAFC